MADREKVIKGLEHCANEADCRGCVYQEQMKGRSDGCDCMREALAMLKEQEAVKPIKMQRMDNFSYFVSYFLCGNCRYELVGKDVMFCSHCGRSVKWE